MNLGPVVERRRLVGAVDEAVRTLVRAPAGSGRTVLLSRWAGRGARYPVGLLTATSRDDDPHVVRWRVRPAPADAGGVGPGVRAELPPGAGDVGVLAYRLSRSGTRVVLVLDAADRVARRDVFDGLTRLVDGTRGVPRVVVSTRQEPPLPLHGYRLEGRLAELSSADLARARTELRALPEAYGVRLSPRTVTELVERTGGWSAGARMAAPALGPRAAGTTLERSAADDRSDERRPNARPVDPGAATPDGAADHRRARRGDVHLVEHRRTPVRKILGKPLVSRRHEAARRARELHLI